jgi:zinc protease
MKNIEFKTSKALVVFCLLHFAFLTFARAQEAPPTPASPKAAAIPKVQEKMLSNKLKVAVVERKNVPLVSVMLQVNSGITSDDLETAGRADMTASLLTKGTRTRTAPQIAEAMEFIGGSINTDLGPDESRVSMSVMTGKLDTAMAIFSDILINPTFPQKEIDLAKSLATDELNNNLKQPGFLASYVSSVYSFWLSPAKGTPESIKEMTRKTIIEFYRDVYLPENGTLIFVGDISPEKAFQLAQKFFGRWKNPPAQPMSESPMMITESADSNTSRQVAEANQPLVKRILVIDLPDSGQAAVTFNKHMQFAGRIVWDDQNEGGKFSGTYFPATVMNSLLGGGYSSRLNQEIRIKRGLSYGAGSSFSWRSYDSRFSTRTQTKNQSAAEVASLVIDELKKLIDENPDESELTPRKAVLIGAYQNSLETNEGLTRVLAEMYANWLPTESLGSYVDNVRGVNFRDVRAFSSQNLKGGDIVVVGDANIFMNDLKKRFPGFAITVVNAKELNLKSLKQE